MIIDKNGNCPNCGQSWNGGDILKALSKMECNLGRDRDYLITLAKSYGWTPENPTHFSTVRVREADGSTLYQCSNMRCQHIFNRDTGIEYSSMISWNLGQPVQMREKVRDRDQPLEDNFPF